MKAPSQGGLSLHCTGCAFITTTTGDAMAHVAENPTHTVIGPGRDPDTTITIYAEGARP